MRPNTVKWRLRTGKPAIGTWLTLGSPLAAEHLGHQGFDWLSVARDHCWADAGWTRDVLRAIATTDAAPLVRLSGCDQRAIGWALDAGARGVFVPGVESCEDAEAIVRATRRRPRDCHGLDDGVRSDDEPLVIVMVDIARGWSHLDDILATPGVDACFVDPTTLGAANDSLSDSEAAAAAVDDVLRAVGQACRRRGVAPGIQVRSAEEALRRLGEGWQLVAIGSEGALLAQAAASTVRALQQRDAGSEAAAPVRGYRVGLESGCAVMGAPDVTAHVRRL